MSFVPHTISYVLGVHTQISVMSPGDMVKVRLQCQTEGQRSGFKCPKPKYRGPIHCLLTVAREEGILGLYKGALPLACRDGPSYATYFLTYNTLCSKLTKPGQKQPGESNKCRHLLTVTYWPESPDPCRLTRVVIFTDWSAVLFAGGVAGMAGWSVGTPMDVIKARLQMDGVREQKRYRGFVHCITETVRNEGPTIFFKSLGINCLRAFPVNMVVFAVYEVTVGILRPASVGPLSWEMS